MKNKLLFKVKDVNKSYDTGAQSVHAIRNLTCEIYHSDFTVIMGSSGSGKSTLLYLLSGMDHVTSGEVSYKEIPIHQLKEKQLLKLRKKDFGMVYQGIHLIPYLTLLENVVVPARLNEKNHKKALSKSTDLLKTLDLEKEYHRLPAQVSGGQQQRAAVARALVNDCDVLFADEPTGALNTSQGENLLDTLTKVNQNGKSIVMVTHDIKAACRGNRILFIEDGKIDGTLNLSPYHLEEDIDEREQKIYSFLRRKGW
jgi:putative ABC transport system ATP-binding protein